jgi:hypothetical protein
MLRQATQGGLAGSVSAQERLEEPVRVHQCSWNRVGAGPGSFQAETGPQDSVVYADQVLAVGAASGLIDQAAIGLVGLNLV